MSSAAATIRYSPLLEAEVSRLEQILSSLPGVREQFPLRWLAIQLLEGDDSRLQETAERRSTLRAGPPSWPPSPPAASDSAGSMAKTPIWPSPTSATSMFTASSSKCSPLPCSSGALPTASTVSSPNRWLGIPIFLALMYFVFSLVQNVSAPYLDYVDGVFSGPVTAWTTTLLESVRAPAWTVSLATDGVISGVGAVLVFLPGLIVMYLSLAVLEDSGYLARAAFVMDRAMSKMGLHGRSFMPMILGFGCNVPAIYATRYHRESQRTPSHGPAHSLHVLLRAAARLCDLRASLLPAQWQHSHHGALRAGHLRRRGRGHGALAYGLSRRAGTASL